MKMRKFEGQCQKGNSWQMMVGEDVGFLWLCVTFVAAHEDICF
jgi:hypothetical protein